MHSNHDHTGPLPGDTEDPVASSTWVVGIIFTVLIAVTVIGVTAIFYHADDVEIEEKLFDNPLQMLADLQANQEDRINSEPYIRKFVNEDDQEVSEVVIPVDRAMDLIVADIAAGKAP